MKQRIIASGLLLAFLLILSLPALAETVTEIVEKKMNSYFVRELYPNDLSLTVGLPLVLGVEYDRAANANFALGVGVGSFIQGSSLNAQVRFYPLTSEFSPYLGAGMTYYYILSDANVLAWHADAGLDYTFERGWGLSLGATYARFINTSVNPFSSSSNVSDKIDAANVQFGVHFRF